MKTERTRTKIVLSLLTLGSALMFVAFCKADDPGPDKPSGPVLQSDSIPIPELPYTISEPGSYCLTQNLTHTDRYTNAIEIDANNVTIDLGGYSIIGPTSSYVETCNGIYSDMHSNIEIRNGTITNFPNRGVFIDNSGETLGSTGNRIISVRVKTTGAEGIVLWGFHHTIKDCTVTYTQLELNQGLGGITCGSFCFVSDNVTARHNIIGIRTLSGCTIRDNTIGECSFGIATSNGCSIADNTILATFDGISIIDASGCMIRGNTIRECERDGIHMEGFDNAIEENLVTSCGVGINFVYGENVYANNRALYNGTNYDGQVPTGVYDGGGNIGIGTFVGGNLGTMLKLETKSRVLKKLAK